MFDTLQNGIQDVLKGLYLLDFLTYIIMPLFLICIPRGIYIFASKLKYGVTGIFFAQIFVYCLKNSIMLIYLN